MVICRVRVRLSSKPQHLVYVIDGHRRKLYCMSHNLRRPEDVFWKDSTGIRAFSTEVFPSRTREKEFEVKNSKSKWSPTKFILKIKIFLAYQTTLEPILSNGRPTTWRYAHIAPGRKCSSSIRYAWVMSAKIDLELILRGECSFRRECLSDVEELALRETLAWPRHSVLQGCCVPWKAGCILGGHHSRLFGSSQPEIN